MRSLLERLVSEEQGQDLIEYALLAGLISLASVVAIKGISTGIQNVFTTVSAEITP